MAYLFQWNQIRDFSSQIIYTRNIKWESYILYRTNEKINTQLKIKIVLQRFTEKSITP